MIIRLIRRRSFPVRDSTPDWNTCQCTLIFVYFRNYIHNYQISRHEPSGSSSISGHCLQYCGGITVPSVITYRIPYRTLVPGGKRDGPFDGSGPDHSYHRSRYHLVSRPFLPSRAASEYGSKLPYTVVHGAVTFMISFAQDILYRRYAFGENERKEKQSRSSRYGSEFDRVRFVNHSEVVEIRLVAARTHLTTIATGSRPLGNLTQLCPLP